MPKSAAPSHIWRRLPAVLTVPKTVMLSSPDVNKKAAPAQGPTDDVEPSSANTMTMQIPDAARMSGIRHQRASLGSMKPVCVLTLFSSGFRRLNKTHENVPPKNA